MWMFKTSFGIWILYLSESVFTCFLFLCVHAEFYMVNSCFWIVINWGIVTGLVSVLILVLVILSISLPGLIKYSNNETQKDLRDKLNGTQKLMCGIPDELDAVFKSIDLISSEKLDNRAKGIYQQIQWGKDIQSCDVVYFYDQLNAEQKKRLNWPDLSCNVSYC